MSNPEIVPLTSTLFEEFYGQRSPWLIKGFALMIDGKAAALGGIAFVGDRWLAFSEVPEEIRHMRKSIYAVGKKVADLAANCRLPVIAARDEDEPTSERFLTHLGFHEDGEYWRFG